MRKESIPADLSKAFDCISHDLQLAKLGAHEFDKKTAMFLSACLNNRSQKGKAYSYFSESSDILSGVLKGSVTGRLLFNIYTCDTFQL